MRRWLHLPLTAAAFALVNSSQLMAQGASWPAYPLKNGWSGPGGYLNWIKILVCWLIFLAWCGTTDWVSRDAQEHRTNYLRWNPILFGTFAGAFLLHWALPWFWLGFPLLLIAYVAPLATYVVLRNRKVGDDERVLTPDHLRHWISQRAKLLGLKIAAEKKDPHEAGPPLILTARGGTEREDNVHLLSARQSPGFTNARVLLADGLYRHADAIMLDYTQESVGVKHMVDGVWHESAGRDREQGDPILASLKLLSGLNPEDRRGRQEGRFAAQYDSEKFAATIVTQGTPTGERALVTLEGKKVRFDTMEALGMRSKMEEQVREIMAREQGFFLISAMPTGGLRSTTSVILRSSDRFMREFYAVEEAVNRYEEVENVHVTTYKAAEGQTPVSVLPEVFFQDPNVVVVRDLVNGETVGLLCSEIPKNRLIVGTIRAKDCAEALLRVLALKTPPADFARGITAVLSQRLIRKLCPRCKEAYAPTPDMLQRMGIPAGKIEALYRPPQPPATEEEQKKHEICPECTDIGYVGRTAIFELLVVDDTVRKTLAASPKLDLLRQAARKAGMRSLQEEGIVLVAKGVTSLAELMRVLKQ
jgi:type II secretory ATPase GspE/PulE/Tfp pilus assembly ATPase PilB-like protein